MSEMRDILTDTVTRLFADLVTRETLQDAENGIWPEALWNACEENGLTLALVPEERGGAGLSWADSFAIARAAGYYGPPIPLVETMLGAWLLAGAGIDVPDGPMTVAPVRAIDSLLIDGSALSGKAAAVPWGRQARHTVVLTGGAVALAALDAATIEEDCNIAREPRDTVTFDNAPIVALAQTALPPDTLQLYGAMFRAAQLAGGVARALDETVQYAGDRIQFGRPIGKFQAIQQNLAALAGQMALAGAAAEMAFRAADRGNPQFEAASAKVVTGDAASSAAATAHQIHGAIGFTYEHILQFTTRRLWSWRAEFGAESRWAEELGRGIAGRGADAFWPDLTARQAGMLP
ncbi:MAG: acyl-CoA dehydrogenase [Alphaproteobacteria bacterium]|nr:acyl-CoA dehydrogenase [Alphaproteobacteria bacterium]